jgi:hypothetical protein
MYSKLVFVSINFSSVKNEECRVLIKFVASDAF